MRNEWIWLDMDGTIADLYKVNGWLEYLMAFDTTPYAKAEMIYNQLDLLTVLAELKIKGYKIGIISWGSKANNAEYDKRVEEVKKAWLFDKCLDILLDKVIVTPYGVCKADTCRQYGKGILVDDEEQNRNAWDLGATIDANENIITELWKLVAQGLTKPHAIGYNKFRK